MDQFVANLFFPFFSLFQFVVRQYRVGKTVVKSPAPLTVFGFEFKIQADALGVGASIFSAFVVAHKTIFYIAEQHVLASGLFAGIDVVDGCIVLADANGGIVPLLEIANLVVIAGGQLKQLML